ncbi:hypothetical protein PN465_11090 [Nodularia spumigena CS-584]|uniref:hypothetical protein n=1 Tax=Nodularia spumigena TaxID=70799 RepID=UPI0000EAAAFC|nr:hypothetical protein [Nodularia spumigena]AHJ30969.1 hypothetical protein NSP_46780 [Nodularia spumigena CCY9414]EAW46383.1 hypothetical protein N9414_11764 [Nodularia spumigena CCY9414]MDB9382761.1 hypothetical protein [Nodularia spumigena CS-584]
MNKSLSPLLITGIYLIVNLCVALTTGFFLQPLGLTRVILISLVIFLSWLLLPLIFPIRRSSTVGTNHGFGTVATFLSLGILYEVFPQYPFRNKEGYLEYILAMSWVTPFLADLCCLYGLGLGSFPLVLTIPWLLLASLLISMLNLGTDKLSYAIYFPGFLLPILQLIALIPGLIKFFLLETSVKIELGQNLLIVVAMVVLASLGAVSIRETLKSQESSGKPKFENPRVCIFVRVVNSENQDGKTNSHALDKQRKPLHSYADKQGYELDRIQYTVDDGSIEETEELSQYRQGLEALFKNPSYNIFLVEKEEHVSRFGIVEAKRTIEENGKYLEVFNPQVQQQRQESKQQSLALATVLQSMVIVGGLTGGWFINFKLI